MQGEKFTEEQMTSFGNYIQSAERLMRVVRCENFLGENEVKAFDRVQQVSHADFENWKHENSK